MTIKHTDNQAICITKLSIKEISSVVTIASEPTSIDYDRSFEKKSRCRCRFDVTWACGLTIS